MFPLSILVCLAGWLLAAHHGDPRAGVLFIALAALAAATWERLARLERLVAATPPAPASRPRPAPPQLPDEPVRPLVRLAIRDDIPGE